MDVLVWGCGSYYQKKKKIISEFNVKAFIGNDDSENFFEGKRVITPGNINCVKWDKIIIMSTYIVEIVDKIKTLEIDSTKILFGINFPPLTTKELKYISDTKKIEISPDYKIVYKIENTIIAEITCSEKLHELSNYNENANNINLINKLDVNPASRIFAYDRGSSIARYYIEQFIKENSSYISGTVMEIGDRDYTTRYGKDVKNSYVLHKEEGDGEYNICGDFETGNNIPEASMDCIILTQTLNFIYNTRSAVQNVIRCLKPNGVALVTVSGISQISRFDMDRWGHYWQFTDQSLYQLFSDVEEVESVSVSTYGNAKSCTAFLYGAGADEIDDRDIRIRDRDYQLIVSAIVKRGINE